jgi:Tol biopolymer transport system component
VVFWTGSEEDGTLARVSAKGGTPEKLAPHPARDPGPSPVDERIVFVAGKDGKALSMLGGDGAVRPFGVHLPDGILHGPAFSPDGKRVAVVVNIDQLLVLDAESGRVLEAQRVERGSLQHPVWSPDGKLYVIATDWIGDLWLADLE